MESFSLQFIIDSLSERQSYQTNSLILYSFYKWARDHMMEGICLISFLDQTIEFYLPVTIVIIPDVLVTNLITKLYQSCLLVMTCQTMLAGMKFSINGTQNSHVPHQSDHLSFPSNSLSNCHLRTMYKTVLQLLFPMTSHYHSLDDLFFLLRSTLLSIT